MHPTGVEDIIGALFSCVVFGFLGLALVMGLVRFLRQASAASRGGEEEPSGQEGGARPDEEMREFLAALRGTTRPAPVAAAPAPKPAEPEPSGEVLVGPIRVRVPPRASRRGAGRAIRTVRPAVPPASGPGVFRLLSKAAVPVVPPSEVAATPVPRAARRLEEILPRDLLKRGILLSEILGPCRALSPYATVGDW